MTRSESVQNIGKALCKAQSDMKSALKDSVNPHLRSKYADLTSILDVVRAPLTENGICWVQIPECAIEAVPPTVSVETTLIHESGEWISGKLSLPLVKTDAQGVGSAITYAKRYSLAAMVGVATEDDDGEAASAKPTPTQPVKPVVSFNSEAAIQQVLAIVADYGVSYNHVDAFAYAKWHTRLANMNREQMASLYSTIKAQGNNDAFIATLKGE